MGTGAIDVTVTGGTTPYFYEWIRNGVPYGKSQDLKRIPAGNYHLEVYDANYCTIVGQTITIQSNLTSTQDHPWTSLVKIAPNPTNGLLNVYLDLPQFVSIQPEVISPLGVTVIKLPRQQLQKGSFEVNLENHPSGVYFLKLNLIESTIIKRILLVH